ncbi:MAG: hypothetical protein RL092_1551 [Bacteroidota bacterium]|jgi:hypothetical protein
MNKITLSPYRRKHILQHFHGSKEAGSVFHPHVFAEPESLLHFLQQNTPVEVRLEYADREVWIYHAQEFESVGTLGLALRSELGEAPVVAVARGRYTHQVALVEKLPETNFICAVVKRVGEELHLITAFPGKETAPFPTKKQPPHERHRSIAFWKAHILLAQKQA